MNLEHEIDALFALPLSEFTGARNALAAKLKKEGGAADAERVKSFSKPSVSAWAVNQLYWRHREAFEQLLSTGEQVRQAQASHLSGKAVDLRGSLDDRRFSLNKMLRLAEELLREAGHNPAPDILRRIGTSLDAISAHSSSTGSPTLGRLTDDVEPPGFDALAALIPDVPARAVPAPPAPKKVSDEAQIASAKAALREAERALKQVRAIANEADAARKQAASIKKEAETLLREAHERLIAAEAEAADAAKAMEQAESAVKKASQELHSLLEGTRR